MRASTPLGDAYERGALPWWRVPEQDVEIFGHHFGLIGESAALTAQAIDTWVRGLAIEAATARPVGDDVRGGLMEAKAWFIVGASLFMGAGGGHALLTLLDMARPTFFTPIDGAVRSSMETTGFRFRSLFPGNDGVTPTMWRIWLGFNASHGIGAFVFGLMCVLIASHDFGLVTDIGALRPLTIAVSGSYFALALRFWFYVPALITGTACACFTVAAFAT